jgi:hypothetical protein
VDALRAPDGQPWRVASTTSTQPAYGSVAALGLQAAGGYDPFNLRHYQTFMDVLRYNRSVGDRAAVWMDVDEIARFDLLDALNVRFVTSPTALPPTMPLTLVREFDDQPQLKFYTGIERGPVYVYRNDNARARAFFVSDVVRADTAQAMTASVLGTDVRDTAVVLGGDAGASTASPDDRVDLRRWRAGELDIVTHAAARRFLVISEVWHPGWRATVDGRPVPLHQTDIALQGLWLDAGDHVVELRFWPVGLTAGMIITGMTIVLVLALVLVGRAEARPYEGA